MNLAGKLVYFLISALFMAGCISPELRTLRIAINEKDWQRALASADAEIARMPLSAEPYYWKGFIYEHLRDWENMSANYDKALELSDKFTPQILERRARLVAQFLGRSLRYYDIGDSIEAAVGNATDLVKSYYDSSLACLDTAIVIDPKDIRLHRQAAVMAYNSGRYDRAVISSLKAIEIEPTDTADITTRQVLVSVYQAQGNYSEVIRWARDLMGRVAPASDETDTYLTALDALIGAYEKTGDVESAQQVVNEAIAHFPDRVELRLNLAFFLIRKQDYVAAETAYREVLKLAPDNFDANLNLGTILVKSNRFAEAIPYLEKAHNLKPDNRVAVQNLTSAYYNTDQLEKGAEMKKKLDKMME